MSTQAVRGLYQHIESEFNRLQEAAGNLQSEKAQMLTNALLLVQSMMGSPLHQFLGSDDEECTQILNILLRIIQGLLNLEPIGAELLS